MIKHEIEMVLHIERYPNHCKECSISSLIHAIMKEGWKAVVN